MADIAKVFKSGGSQAIRLPKQYRFDEDEVLIYREGNRVVLESRKAAWSEQFLNLAGTVVEFPYPDDPPVV
jgi:antitoxin VapB